MGPDEVAALSSRICQRVMDLPAFKEANAAALYSPIRNEVDTESIFHAAKALGKRLLYPRVSQASLTFCEVSHLSELELGAWGILEPQEFNEVSIAMADLIIVPGVAFDRSGRRLGYGKGYYDRALQDFSGYKLGLAFACQIVEALPENSGDVPLDLVMTESGSYPARP